MLAPVLRILSMPSDLALTIILSNRYDYFHILFTDDEIKA